MHTRTVEKVQDTRLQPARPGCEEGPVVSDATGDTARSLADRLRLGALVQGQGLAHEIHRHAERGSHTWRSRGALHGKEVEQCRRDVQRRRSKAGRDPQGPGDRCQVGLR